MSCELAVGFRDLIKYDSIFGKLSFCNVGIQWKSLPQSINSLEVAEQSYSNYVVPSSFIGWNNSVKSILPTLVTLKYRSYRKGKITAWFVYYWFSKWWVHFLSFFKSMFITPRFNVFYMFQSIAIIIIIFIFIYFYLFNIYYYSYPNCPMFGRWKPLEVSSWILLKQSY